LGLAEDFLMFSVRALGIECATRLDGSNTQGSRRELGASRRHWPLLMPDSAASVCYRFGRFELQPDERRLLAAGSPVRVGPHAFDLFIALVERSGRLVVASRQQSSQRDIDCVRMTAQN
jgi:hypothetical protein